jgi:hypothetical protein
MNGLLGWLLWVLMKWNEARGLNTELCLCGRTQSMEVLGGTEAGAGFKEAQLISPTLLRSKSVGDEWHTWKEILREMLPTTPADPWHLWGQEWYRRSELPKETISFSQSSGCFLRPLLSPLRMVSIG